MATNARELLEQIRQQKGQSNPVQVNPTQTPDAKTLLEKVRQGKGEKPSFMDAFSVAAANGFVNNMLGVPNLLYNAFQHTPPMQLLNMAQGKKVPSLTDESIPTPEATDIFAGLRTAGQAVGNVAQGQSPNILENFNQNRTNEQELQQYLATQRPGATTTGEITGDVATLLTGRAPLAGMLAKIPQKSAVKTTAPGVKRLLETWAKSAPAQRLARGAGRSLETGVEGAVIAALNDGDPLETGAYAAGAQLGGSFALEASKGLLSGGPTRAGLKLGLAAGGIASIVQLAKEATPGGKDRILESVETGYKKVLFGLAAGAVSGAAGLGRVRGNKFAEDLPKIADAITAIPRGAVLSVLSDVLDENEKGIDVSEKVLNKLQIDPDYFGPEAKRRLGRALTSPNVSFSKEIEKLSSNNKFLEKLDEL